MSITSPQEVIRTQLAVNNSTSVVGNEIMANAMGKDVRTNESVQVTPDQSDLTDALEELGMSVAHRGKPDLEKMKARRGVATDVDALSRILDYLDQLPGLPSEEKYKQLVDKLQKFQDMSLSGGSGGDAQITADDIAQMLADYDGDITHQAVALERLRKDAVASGAAPAVLAAIDQLRGAFSSPDAMREIRAGLASGREAHQMGDRFGADPRAYRESYRELLRDPQPRLGPVFDSLRKFSLTETFDDVIDSFLKVAGTDLGSVDSSVDPVHLGSLMTELSKLKNLRTVLKSSEDVAIKLDRAFPPEGGKTRPSGEEIASRLLHFSGMTLPTFTDANGLLRGYEGDPPEVPVMVVNLLRGQHAALPDTVVPSLQAHEQQGRLLLNLSDRVVETEEKAFGG